MVDALRAGPARGEKPRQVLLPDIVSRSLLTLRGDAGANDPVLPQARPAHRARGARDGETHGGKGRRQCCDLSLHWLRHAHGSHAIEEGAPLHEVQATLGHANIATTSGEHARPGSSSGLKLDPGVFLQNGDD